MNISKLNKEAWDHQVLKKNKWTIPVEQNQINEAKAGRIKIVLTPEKTVPIHWLEPLKGKSVLALASGGGQQGPLLAAAGAMVTVYDQSPLQLKQDQDTANRFGLILRTLEGDMANLSALQDSSFDLIFHPCSNCFVPNVLPVWKECARVLKSGGHLVSGFVNPVIFTMDLEKERQGIAQMKYPIPFSELDYPDDPEIKAFREKNDPVSFGHTLEDQIGGQLRAGFHIIDLFEDNWKSEDPSPVHRFINGYMATRSVCVKQP